MRVFSPFFVPLGHVKFSLKIHGLDSWHGSIWRVPRALTARPCPNHHIHLLMFPLFFLCCQFLSFPDFGYSGLANSSIAGTARNFFIYLRIIPTSSLSLDSGQLGFESAYDIIRPDLHCVTHDRAHLVTRFSRSLDPGDLL